VVASFLSFNNFGGDNSKQMSYFQENESHGEPAAYERAATGQRGSLVLSVHKIFQTHCLAAVGFLLLRHQ
jgi:hypothetical protein